MGFKTPLHSSSRAFNRNLGLAVAATAASLGILLLFLPSSGAAPRVFRNRIEGANSTPVTRTMFGKKKEEPKEKELDVYDGGPDEEERELAAFTNSENMEVGYRIWRPKGGGKPSKGLIFIVHGMHEHGGRYADNAHWWVKKGYTVCASDHEGHGRSYGDKGFISDWQHLISDNVQFIKKMVDKYHTDNGLDKKLPAAAAADAAADAAVVGPPTPPGPPVFILGHSMGSLITALSLVALAEDEEDGGRYRTAVKAVVFSGCPLVPGPAAASPLGFRFLYGLNKAPRLLTSLAKTFAAADPHGPNAPIDESCLTSDPATVERIRRDALHFEGKVKNKTAFEFIKMSKAVRENVHKITIPAYMFHGEEDEIAYPDGTRQLTSLIGSQDKETIFYPGLKHEVLNEPSWPTTMEAIQVFLDKHHPLL